MINKQFKHLIYTDYYRLTSSEFNLKSRVKLMFASSYGRVDWFRLMCLFGKAKESKGIIGKINRLKYYRFAKKAGAEIPLETNIGQGFII